MMNNPLVTALIDTYNHELFIEDALNSVLQQDFPSSDLEIIVVDDGSADRTAEIVRKFAPRVRLMQKPNGGQASAFNAGIAEARGELIAFLDGDDWWAAGKLGAVTKVFAGEAAVGLVGHGVTQVFADNRLYTEVIREPTRFRVTSVAEAKKFRMCRGFFGTSRMTCRRELVQRIGAIPEILRFEADEYLFTLAALRSEVAILPDALTFYRLHDKNLFQLTNASKESTQLKQTILAALARSLRDKLERDAVPKDIAATLVECVQLEADFLRLVSYSGPPWETLAVERKIMRVFHSDASVWQNLFSLLRLIPAVIMPAASYYRWRQRLSSLGLYQTFRRSFFPFPVPKHIERREDRSGAERVC
jgi:glycosyltransferase involved in cell wall biosynthesis